MLRDQNGNLYTDVLELHTIDLKKKPHKEQPCPLDEWHCLFNAETEEDLDMIKSGTKNLGIIEAIKELKEISLTDRLRYEHEMRLKAKRDRRAEDKFVYVQGQKDGIEIGKAQGFSVLIDYMRNNGLSDEQIIAELMVNADLAVKKHHPFSIKGPVQSCKKKVQFISCPLFSCSLIRSRTSFLRME